MLTHKVDLQSIGGADSLLLALGVSPTGIRHTFQSIIQHCID